ncbi:inactive leucine-rich repeat receptor-like serine/threonine-protein kinase At1g60630 [Salvia miltiorrhiza]|uniref:inactive leucine-rich repeat receptor-like serine/threonine-protein kinase At1g60630 n=1 Tax=Salvia miltiorrhiza TaxID=226208 RepID=UPI0025ABF069|nr:inactive leucine-rich repeat receptor-like serine/threonine-protein kinase At1g60630 [Salvia miltiorrhiza]
MDGVLPVLVLRHNPFCSLFLFSPLLLMFITLPPLVRSGDAEALLALRASMDPVGVLPWARGGGDVCQWQGVKECLNGRVTKLVVERFNLNGTLDGKSLNQLDQLRVLSFKENSISGQIPELPGLLNLKSLYLNNNRFSGRIPVSLARMHRLKVVVLSENRISGQIPQAFLSLSRLYVLFVQDNRLSGAIPPFNQTSLRFFNVSNNLLSGRIPITAALAKFDGFSFLANVDLCGEQIQKPCRFGPSTSPSYSVMPGEMGHHHKWNKRLILIPVLSVIGFILLCIVAVVFMACLRNRGEEKEARGKVAARGVEEGVPSGVADDNAESKHGAFSWDQGGEGLGSLTFLGDEKMNYSLEDLLKASAETLGRGTLGSTYKAVMESGYILTVKRLKDARYPTMEEFRRHIEILGRLRHPNLVPLRAYFQAKEERLLVYDYFPNGSLFSLVHGSRAAGGSKPLHWTSCLKIAEDVATGLLYIHQNPGLTHGNLKSTNVLLGSDFESCLTDYGLSPFRNPESHEESSASSLFYRAPECRDPHRPLTQKADVYSYGILLLELLTGKTPFHDFVQEHGSDIPRWVRSIRDAETESSDDPASSNEASEEKISALLDIAMASVAAAPENRPATGDVVRMIREARVEAHLSSNSSGHSPGRWSDTIHSLPREEHLTM